MFQSHIVLQLTLISQVRRSAASIVVVNIVVIIIISIAVILTVAVVAIAFAIVVPATVPSVAIAAVAIVGGIRDPLLENGKPPLDAVSLIRVQAPPRRVTESLLEIA